MQGAYATRDQRPQEARARRVLAARSGRIPWQLLIISSGLLVIIGSMITGVWLAVRAVSPWAGSFIDIRQIEERGSRFYDTGPAASRLDEQVSRIWLSIKRKQYAEALRHIDAGRAEDPRNPLFDYLQARVYADQADWPRVFASIRDGNNRGILRLYATSRASPDRWIWPEFDLIRFVGKAIVRRFPDQKSALTEALVMSNKLVWCEPPDPGRLWQSVGLRLDIARRLLPIAQEEQDARLANECLRIARESVSLRAALREKMTQEDPFMLGSQAWILGRAMQGQGKRFRDAATLLYLERQAEWITELRDSHLRTRVLRL